MRGSELKDLIVKSGIEQAEIARRLGMSLQALQKRYKPDEVKGSFVKRVQDAINQKVDSYKPSTKGVKPGNKLDVLVDTVQSLATSVAEDRTMVKKRFESVEANLDKHGKDLELLLNWKEGAARNILELAKDVTRLKDGDQKNASARKVKQKGTGLS